MTSSDGHADHPSATTVESGMRDPIENKDILPSISWYGSDADSAIQAVYTELRTAHDRMRVLSFTRDAERDAEYAGFDCCWSRPRMWEQYGDLHRGVCLSSSAQSTTRGRASAPTCVTSTPLTHIADGRPHVLRAAASQA